MLRLLTLFAIVALVAQSSGDISGSNPPYGSCLCLDGYTVNVRDDACGDVVGQASTGHCFKYRGENENCVMYEDSYVFYKVTFGYKSGWMAGIYLTDGIECQCQERADEAIYNSTLPGCPNIETRAEWVARNPRSITYINNPVPKVIIHSTGHDPCYGKEDCETQMRSIQDYYIDEKERGDTVYNFNVGEDGNAYDGVGWDRKGASAGNWSSVSIGIGVIGNFAMSPPNATALRTVQQLIACGVFNGKISANYTLHTYCDTVCGECPDNALIDAIKMWPRWGGNLPGGC